MPIVGVDKRIARYQLKLNPERVKQDLENMRASMISAATERQIELATLEDVVKGVLADEDLATVTYVWYHSFAREIYRKRRRFGGGKGLEREAAILVDKWVERGCVRTVLHKMLIDVFAIPAPAT